MLLQFTRDMWHSIPHINTAIAIHSRTIVDFLQHHQFVEDSLDRTALTFVLIVLMPATHFQINTQSITDGKI